MNGVFQNFCVVVPMYNEAIGVERCVRGVIAALQPFGDRPKMIAVNDGSSDSTLNTLNGLALQYPGLIVIDKPINAGYGAALRTGAEHALGIGFEYAIFMDSDLTNDPADIGKFAAKMAQNYDVIKASRFSAGGGMNGVPFRRSVFSRLGNMIGRSFFRLDLHDVTNGFRAVRLRRLMETNVHERGFPSIVEELYEFKRIGATFSEVPVVLTSRAEDLRPTAFAYKPSTFRRYLKYCILALLTRMQRRSPA